MAIAFMHSGRLELGKEREISADEQWQVRGGRRGYLCCEGGCYILYVRSLHICG